MSRVKQEVTLLCKTVEVINGERISAGKSEKKI